MSFTGLVTYYVLFFMHLESRRVSLAGMTPYPDQEWMEQQARNVLGTYIKDAYSLTQGKDLPSLIYHEPAPEVRFVRWTAARFFKYCTGVLVEP
jgi:hypothetical protein